MNYYGYDEIAATVIILLGLAGSFVLIGNCVELIRKWIAVHRDRQAKVENKVDFLKEETTRHKNDYKDIVNLKRQVGAIEESVQKIDKALDRFISDHEEDMKNLNEETALQTGAIKSLLDHAIDNNHNENLISQRRKFDEFLIHRGR